MVLCKLVTDENACNRCCFYCDDTECYFRCGEEVIGNKCELMSEDETAMKIVENALPNVITTITEITKHIEQLEEQQKAFKEQILKVMESNGIKKFENEYISFTYTAPTTRTSVDSVKLKKKYPEIAEECSKVSEVAASVRIKVK